MINDSYDLVIGIYLGIIFYIIAYKFLPNYEMIMEDNILNLIFISFFITIFFIIKNILYSFNKWFEINLGWFFINGRKQDQWGKYLREKYGDNK